jgi:hypothetical protein
VAARATAPRLGARTDRDARLIATLETSVLLAEHDVSTSIRTATP